MNHLKVLESKIDPVLLAEIGVLEAIASNDAQSLALQLIARRKAIRRHLAAFDWEYSPIDWPSNPFWYDRPDVKLVPRKLGRPRYDLAFGIWESQYVLDCIKRELLDMRTAAVMLGGVDDIPYSWFAEADTWPHDRFCIRSLADQFPLDREQAGHIVAFTQSLPDLADWRRRTHTPNPGRRNASLAKGLPA